MSLLDSFKGHVKNSFNTCRTVVTTDAAKVVDIFKTKISDFRIEHLSKLSKNAKIFIGAGALGVVVISTAVFVNLADEEIYTLAINGEQVGYLSEMEIMDKVLEEIKADLSEVSPEAEIIINEEAVEITPADVKKKDVSFLTGDQLKDKILEADICKANAWAININGENIVAAATKEQADSILQGIISHYQSPGSEIVSSGFKEEVDLLQAAVSVTELLTVENAIPFILTGSKEPKVYTVQDGDTIWDIAVSNGMKTSELIEANPGFDPNRLKIGQELNLFQTNPFVTVQIKEIVSQSEKIDFKTVYETTDTLYKGEIKVKTPGVYGSKDVRTEVTKENGVVVGSAVLESLVASEPQDQVALKGTKSIATFTGSGTLSSPVGHIEISSAYGSRGGGRHTGVDLRNPKGTPIKAADDGVVVYAAYSGSYGNIVKLSHGNGLETWYAHCDTMSVSTGQVVSKGQNIATVGITGRATGYHLHFEVRKNGVPQNPMNYL